MSTTTNLQPSVLRPTSPPSFSHLFLCININTLLKTSKGLRNIGKRLITRYRAGGGEDGEQTGIESRKKEVVPLIIWLFDWCLFDLKEYSKLRGRVPGSFFFGTWWWCSYARVHMKSVSFLLVQAWYESESGKAVSRGYSLSSILSYRTEG